MVGISGYFDIKVNNPSKKMRSHRFINSLLYLVIQLVAKESKAKENNWGISHSFVLFIDKRYISQVIHFKRCIFFPPPTRLILAHSCSLFSPVGIKSMSPLHPHLTTIAKSDHSPLKGKYVFNCIP